MLIEQAPALLSFEVPPSLLAASVARDRLEPFRDLWSADRFNNVRLIVSELVANGVVHGPGGAPITVRLHGDGDGVRGAVSDQGPGFVLRPRETRPLEHGNGLLIVDALADRWGVHDGAPTTVWFELVGVTAGIAHPSDAAGSR
jgi:anti-sigma regulatory factor (Ser/Thr protein kinase)